MVVGRRAKGRTSHAKRPLRMRIAVCFGKVDCELVLVEVDGSLGVQVFVPDSAKLEVHLHAGANLMDRIFDHHFVDSSLPADGFPLNRESFALGGPPSPAYM